MGLLFLPPNKVQNIKKYEISDSYRSSKIKIYWGNMSRALLLLRSKWLRFFTVYIITSYKLLFLNRKDLCLNKQTIWTSSWDKLKADRPRNTLKQDGVLTRGQSAQSWELGGLLGGIPEGPGEVLTPLRARDCLKASLSSQLRLRGGRLPALAGLGSELLPVFFAHW